MDGHITVQNSNLHYVYYGQPVCTICGDIGHQANTLDGCTTSVCSSCGRRGHKADQCSTACSTCGRVHRLKAPGGACPNDFCLICNMYGHSSPKCPVQQCRTCGCRGHSSTECRACHLCAQHGHTAATCPTKGMVVGQPSSLSSGTQVSNGPAGAAEVAGLDPSPYSVHWTNSSSSGSGRLSYPQANEAELNPRAPAAPAPAGPADVPAGTVFSMGSVSVKLQPTAVNMQQEESRRQTLMETLIAHAEAYALSLLDDGQEQKLTALSRLSESDLAKVLTEPSPELVLDRFWEQYKHYQQQQQSAHQQQQHTAYGAPYQQQAYLTPVQETAYLQQQQQPVHYHLQQLPAQTNQLQVQQPDRAPSQQSSHKAAPPCQLPPDVAAEFERALPPNMLPTDWRTCETWSMLLGLANMLAVGSDKESLLQAKQMLNRAMLQAQAAAAAAMQPQQQPAPAAQQATWGGWNSTAVVQQQEQRQQQPERCEPAQDTSVNGWGSAQASSAALQHAPSGGWHNSHSCHSAALSQHPSGHDLDSPTCSGSASAPKAMTKSAPTAVSYSAAVAAAGTGHHQFKPCNLPLRKPGHGEESVWCQQLIDVLLPVDEGYAAALLQDEQKLSCLCRLMPQDLAIIVQAARPQQFLDQVYQHHIKTRKGGQGDRGKAACQQHLNQLLKRQEIGQICKLAPADIIPEAAQQFESAQSGLLPANWQTYTNWSSLELATQFGGQWFEGKQTFRAAQYIARIRTAKALETLCEEDTPIERQLGNHIRRLEEQQGQRRDYRDGLVGRFIYPCDLLPQHAAELEAAVPPGSLPAAWKEFGSWQLVEGSRGFNIGKDSGGRQAYVKARNQACDATCAALLRAPQVPQPHQNQHLEPNASKLSQQTREQNSQSNCKQQLDKPSVEEQGSNQQPRPPQPTLKLSSSKSQQQRQDAKYHVRPFDVLPELAAQFASALEAAGVPVPDDWQEFEGWHQLEDTLQARGHHSFKQQAFADAKATAVAATAALLVAGEHPDKRVQQQYERAALLSQAPYVAPGDLSPELAAQFVAALPAGTLPEDWRSYSWRKLDDAVVLPKARRKAAHRRQYREAKQQVRLAAAEAFLQQQQQQQDADMEVTRSMQISSSSSAGVTAKHLQPGQQHEQQLSEQARMVGPCELTPEAAAAFEAGLPWGMLPADWRKYAKWGQLELHVKFTVGGDTMQEVQQCTKRYKLAMQQAQEATAAAAAPNSDAAGAAGSGIHQKRTSSGALQADAPVFMPATQSNGAAKGSQSAAIVSGGSSSSVAATTAARGSSINAADASSHPSNSSGAALSAIDGTQRRSSSSSGPQEDTDPLYAPVGPPVCSRCGDEGHKRGACRTPYCDSCETYGHLEGPDCVWACWKCGRHHRALPAGAQCPRYKCFECGLCGHQISQCPSVQCTHCKLFGHKRTECKACTECRQYGHRAKDCPGYCTKCKTPGHKTAACRVVQCAQCGQLGHVLGSAECPAQAGNTSTAAGKQKQQQGKVTFDVTKLQLQQAVASSEAEAARRDTFMNVLLAASKVEGYAMQLLEAPEKLSLLSRLTASDLQDILQQARPEQLLEQCYEHQMQKPQQPQAVEHSTSEQSQQPVKEQLKKDAGSSSFSKRIILPCDLPEHVAEVFESTVLPGSLPSNWRTYRSWRQLETEFADFVKSTGDWIGERRLQFRRQRLAAQAATLDAGQTEKRRQQGWSTTAPPPPPLQQQDSHQGWPAVESTAVPQQQEQQQRSAAAGWPTSQPTATQQQQGASQRCPAAQSAVMQSDAGDVWSPECAQPQQEPGSTDSQQRHSSGGAVPDNQKLSLRHQSQDIVQHAAGAVYEGVSNGLATTYMQPPPQPTYLLQHVMQQQQQQQRMPNAQLQQHTMMEQNAQQLQRQSAQGPPLQQQQQQFPRYGPKHLLPDAAFGFVQSLPAGILPKNWQEYDEWESLEACVNFAVNGAEQMNENVNRFREASQQAELHMHRQWMAMQLHQQWQQHQQQQQTAMVQPAAAYSQAPPVTVNFSDLAGQAGHAAAVAATGGSRLHAGAGGWQNGGAAGGPAHWAENSRHATESQGGNDEDMVEMLGLLGV